MYSSNYQIGDSRMGVNNCLSYPRQQIQRGMCHCPACPRMAQLQPLALPPMALEDPILPPVKEKKPSKMKVLKTIKKKMGLAPRNCSGGAALATPNNLPPLTFSHVHGDNIRITPDGRTARRVESFCKGIAFSARPVAVNEKVSILFSEISNSWSGVLRFGFTSVDPATTAHSLPKYACPDLTNKNGYWAKALAEKFCIKDCILHYYFTSSGDCHFGINGEEKGCFFTGVDVRNPVWVLLDIYGNCTEVKFIDPRIPLEPSRVVDDRTINQSFSAISLNDSLPDLAVQSNQAHPPAVQGNQTQPLPLHAVMGRNVRVLNERAGLVERNAGEFSQGYVFSARPIRTNETLVIQLVKSEPAYSGSLAIGLTSCNPATLRPCDLPDDAEQLLDRPEYWVIKPDAARGLRRGECLTVKLCAGGEVRVAKADGVTWPTVLHVDPSATLWAVADLYGSTKRVRLLISSPTPQPPSSGPTRALRANARTGSAAPVGAPVQPLAAQAGTLLLVSLPPQAQHTGRTLYSLEPVRSGSVELQTVPDVTSSLAGSSITVNQCVPSTANGHCASTSSHCSNGSLQSGYAPSTSSGIYSVIPEAPTAGASGSVNAGECAICCERAVDAVLYTCGHMCMCYACAMRQWRGAGHCPLCRANISDVIRAYRS